MLNTTVQFITLANSRTGTSREKNEAAAALYADKVAAAVQAHLIGGTHAAVPEIVTAIYAVKGNDFKRLVSGLKASRDLLAPWIVINTGDKRADGGAMNKEGFLGFSNKKLSEDDKKARQAAAAAFAEAFKGGFIAALDAEEKAKADKAEKAKADKEAAPPEGTEAAAVEAPEAPEGTEAAADNAAAIAAAISADNAAAIVAALAPEAAAALFTALQAAVNSAANQAAAVEAAAAKPKASRRRIPADAQRLAA